MKILTPEGAAQAMITRTELIAGNWKMHGNRAAALTLARSLMAGLTSHPEGRRRQWLVCPPFVHLQVVQACLHQVGGAGSATVRAAPGSDRVDGPVLALGAQNVAAYADGAVTGEVSAAMLVDAGCAWVILGHSERRTLLAESDSQICSKLERAQAAGLHSIVCVGETLAERETGKTQAVIERQLGALLPSLLAAPPAGLPAPEIVIAYEPIWAIGTGRSATADLAQQVHAQIRGWLDGQGVQAQTLRILYGGSVKASNATALLAMPDIDGVLVGGASLSAAEFLGIGGILLPS